MRVLVSGSRDLTDRAAVWDALDGLYAAWVAKRTQGELFTVIHGGARGADRHADEWARQGLPHVRPEEYQAHWDLLGAHAGHERNARMIQAEPDVVLAFPRGASPGTRGCMKLAKAAGIEVRSL